MPSGARDAPESWGRIPHPRQTAQEVRWRTQVPDFAQRPVLPYGQGRSYGDSCLNDGGVLLTTGALDHLISFDTQTGLLRCEAGATLGTLLEIAVPHGFFLPVLPGTKQVSVGGAIANDIHGKNHHRQGSFGRHLRRLELLRSDGSRVELAPGDARFAATVGGLGLTGLITQAELQLRPVPGPSVRREAIHFRDLEEYVDLAQVSDARCEYTVAWIDCLARTPGRGIFFRGDHTEGSSRPPRRQLAVPFDFPPFALNSFTVRAFNLLYRTFNRPGSKLMHHQPFFFPLDSVLRWNRIYGRRGFFQFQCVVPEIRTIRHLLQRVASAGTGSFLSVLKTFGDLPSPGMLSFPRPGLTLTLDFANRGPETRQLLRALESEVRDAGGALYPAKDAQMSRETFAASYPRAAEFAAHIDPAFSSSFWRRVAG